MIVGNMSKNLAIKGHATRGKEVIEILRMLGGKTTVVLAGDLDFYDYYINSDGFIDYKLRSGFNNDIVYSLEEFLEKFPYKVGDEVQSKGSAPDSETYIIKSMEWNNFMGQIYYTIKNIDGIVNQYKWTAQEFVPYKSQDTMEEKTDTAIAPDLKGEDYSGRRFGYKIPNGYEFECVRNNEIILKPIKPQYPKTYEECCRIMGISRAQLSYTNPDVERGNTYLAKEAQLLDSFMNLRICRNAYWKIAGEEMGLDKPWEPDACQIVYSIGRDSNRISLCNDMFGGYFILEFPTAEIRDVFYENFKDLIEACTELL